jgi:hypothetical protein
MRIRHILPLPVLSENGFLYSVGHSYQNVETINYLGVEPLEANLRR